MTATVILTIVGLISWTAALVLTVHWIWRPQNQVRDDDDYRLLHLCQWVSCRRKATNQVRVHHPAGDVQLWFCDGHSRWACRAQDQAADEQPYDQELDELEDHANGEKR